VIGVGLVVLGEQVGSDSWEKRKKNYCAAKCAGQESSEGCHPPRAGDISKNEALIKE